MNSISFPKIFKGNSTVVLKDKDATENCLKLLLKTNAREMFGDPDMGIEYRTFIYEQNNYILRDIIIDELYTKISTFCPQLSLERKDIQLTSDGNKLIGSIIVKNKIDFTTDTYNLVLFEED